MIAVFRLHEPEILDIVILDSLFAGYGSPNRSNSAIFVLILLPRNANVPAKLVNGLGNADHRDKYRVTGVLANQNGEQVEARTD